MLWKGILMALTITTNLQSLMVQKNLTSATNALNTAMEQMTTGYKINHAGDNAAGFSIANNWVTKLGSIDIATDNAAMGSDLLTTAEENYDLITSHLQRVRDLTEQAANGTYGSSSMNAIIAEINSRLEEITRISKNAEYNGISLMKEDPTAINLQVGIENSPNSVITLAASLFDKATATALLGIASIDKYTEGWTTPGTDIASKLTVVDTAINNVSTRVTNIGASQNRVSSATSALSVQNQNITSSLSTIRDTDVAAVSSQYIQAQILQQASATLLATANQSPSVALNLI
mgnify:CR=1 FL=1